MYSCVLSANKEAAEREIEALVWKMLHDRLLGIDPPAVDSSYSLFREQQEELLKDAKGGVEMSQYTAGFLIGLLEGIEIPDTSEEWGDVTFDCRDGWKVVIFYDCGDIDYIDSFISPTGEIVDFWKWDAETVGRERLINWRGQRG